MAQRYTRRIDEGLIRTPHTPTPPLSLSFISFRNKGGAGARLLGVCRTVLLQYKRGLGYARDQLRGITYYATEEARTFRVCLALQPFGGATT